MNIQQAKDDIKRTVQVYTAKDEYGMYRIPSNGQRPILLMGPPGIGKTAILEQIADECGIGLVSYTMTHHTRQSAIGLPMIEKHKYGGREYAVTEYTMSEILASVYDQIERSGRGEGILFLDEINCVSETLMPAMLQFLQYKTFGTHKLPDGWIIVGAGNPIRYNSSVRELDTVTMDRVKWIEIEPDLPVWKTYAVNRGIHPAVLAFLEWKPEAFYAMQTDMNGRQFVTARGWEDLSRMLCSLEELHLEVTESLPEQYLHHPDIAREFQTFYELWKMSGRTPYQEMHHLSYDRRLCILQIMLQRIYSRTAAWDREQKLAESERFFWEGCRRLAVRIHDVADDTVQRNKTGQAAGSEQWIALCLEQLEQRKTGLQVRRECGLLRSEEENREAALEKRIRRRLDEYRLSAGGDFDSAAWEKTDTREKTADSNCIGAEYTEENGQAAGMQILDLLKEYADYMQDVFAGKQEQYLFAVGLLEHEAVRRFLQRTDPGLMKTLEEITDLDRREQILRNTVS